MARRIPTHQEYLQGRCELALSLIAAYEAGSLGILEACRSLNAVCQELGVSHEEPFVTYLAVDSESHHLPGADQRKLWSSSALDKADSEIQQIEDLYRDSVLEAGCALRDHIGKRGEGIENDA